MPQMAPMWWTTLYIMFIILLMMFFMMIYFNVNYKLMKFYNNKFFKKNNWKW